MNTPVNTSTENQTVDTTTTVLNNTFTDDERHTLIDTFVKTMERPFKTSDASICEIDIRLLTIDTSYRKIPYNMAKHLQKEWNPKLLNIICLSYRNGELYIVDGAAQVIVAIQKDIHRLPAIIYTNLTQKDEATIYLTQRQSAGKLSVSELFQANILTGDPTDAAIKRVCERFDVKIVRSPKNQTGPVLTNVAKTREIVRTTGEDSLIWIFRILKDSGWLNTPGATGGKYLMALQLVYKEGNRTGLMEIFEQNLITGLSKIPSKIFYRLAVSRHPDLDNRMAVNVLMMAIAKGKTTAKALLNSIYGAKD